MKIIKNTLLLAILAVASTKIIFPMIKINRAMDELTGASSNNLDETDEINLAAIILTTIQDHEDLKQLNNNKKEQTYYSFPTSVSSKIDPNVNVKNFVLYAQNGNYENIISILNNPERRTLTILSDSTVMFRLLCTIAASKKKFNEYNEDIFATTFAILISDEQIHHLLSTEQINKLLTKIINKGTVSRLESFLKFDDFAEQITQFVAQNAIIFLAGRGHNFMLQTLLNNPIICSKFDQDTALKALKKAETGQADRVRRSTLCTLFENDIIFNLLKNLELNNYLSKESLQFIYKRTTKRNVKYLMEKLFEHCK